MGEPHHAADDTGVFGCPATVANLCPAVLEAHLHHTLRYRETPLACGDHGPQTHFLNMIFLPLHLREREGEMY